MASGFEELLTSGGAGADQSASRFWSRPDGLLHVQHYRAEYPVAFDPHTHSEYNIVVSLDGAVETRQMGQSELVEPGQAMMGSNPGVEHSSRYLPGADRCEAFSLTFAPRLLSELPSGLGSASMGAARSPVFLGKIASLRIAHAAGEIVRELHAREYGSEIVIEALAMQILVETLRVWPRTEIEPVPVDSTPRLTRRDFVRACEFMRWCKKDEFRLSNLCRFLGTSEERFTRLFRSSANDSPASYYNKMLLERGSDMLRAPDVSVKEVAYELGFKTPSHFIVAFRRRFGRTPLEHRRLTAELC